jgi:type I site-specific restriction endonuclease
MPPEDQARQEIDRQLAAAGWEVQDHRSMNLSVPAVAVREFPLLTGLADYMLYVDGRAMGVVEAKAVGHTLTGVEIQSEKYAAGLPPALPAWHRPLPFAYESTGAETQFTNALEPEYRSRLVFTFHRPEELRRLATCLFISSQRLHSAKGRERERASGMRAVRRNRRSQPSIALSRKGSHLGSIEAVGGYAQG